MSLDDRALPVRYLIQDRDAKLTTRFDDVSRTEGVESPPHSDPAAEGERGGGSLVKTVRTESLDRLLITVGRGTGNDRARQQG
jgi:hypothetical protein